MMMVMIYAAYLLGKRKVFSTRRAWCIPVHLPAGIPGQYNGAAVPWALPDSDAKPCVLRSDIIARVGGMSVLANRKKYLFRHCQQGDECATLRALNEMSDAATIEGKEHIPAEPMLVIPNRMNAAALEALEAALGGRTKVAWMIEYELRPEAGVMQRLLKGEASGFTMPPRGMHREQLRGRILATLAAGRHVVLLPGRPAQAPAAPADVAPEMLRQLLEGYPYPVLPVHVGMYRHTHSPLVVTEGEYEQLSLTIRPALPPGPSAVDSVYAAWMEADAAQATRMVSQLYAAADAAAPAGATLPHVLLRSLLAHPGALVIDGVDNTQMTYRQLMVRATTLARQLRLHVASKRIGIILPPGKYSVIANVACLLAGITPVNIDYHFNSSAFESAASQAGLNRLITENRFIEMQPEFPWPLTRDILFIDALPDHGGQHLPLIVRFLRRVITPQRITKWIRTPEDTREDDEALAVYSAAPGGQVRGTMLSHRAVLAGAALSSSRLCLQPGARVLSALPFHHQAGLLHGLIYPLLAGQDIVTYSLPGAGKRLGELAREHGAGLAVFTPRQAAEVLETAEEGAFHSTRAFLIAGKATEHAWRLAHERQGIHLSECYLPQECAMPVACSMAPPPEAAEGRPALPCGAPGTAGLPLPGVAVRITDLDDPLLVQPRGVQGLVWVKGPGMVSALPEGGSTRPAHERWWCTGDVGMLREDGLLVVHGPRTRFSQIEGEIIFHGRVEQLMAKYLKVQDEPGPPKLAVIGVQDEDSGFDKLVLLSTVHKVLGPHDLITLHYALSNDHESTRMTPGRIIPLRSIPTLPDGQVDYARCMSLYQYLQQRQ